MTFGVDVAMGVGGWSPNALFRFEAGPYRAGQFRVVRFRGRERVNGLFDFRVELAALGIELTTLETLVLGQSACLVIGDLPSRVVHGIIVSIEMAGVHSNTGEPRILMRLVPRAWLLRHRRNSRIFQEKTVREIVSILLTEHGVAFRWELWTPPKPRVYCVQYRETDWEFITRVLAEDGVFFFFSHPGVALSELPGALSSPLGMASTFGGPAGQALGQVARLFDPMETLVLSDRHEIYPPIASAEGGVDVPSLIHEVAPFGGVSPTLVLRDGEGMLPREDYVSEFSLRRAVRTKATLIRQYDFRRPRLDLRGDAAVDAIEGVRPSVGLGASGVTATVETDAPLSLPPELLRQYHHHAEDEEPDASRTRAHTLLEQHRADRRRGRGRSWCRRLVPGSRFSLAGHGLAPLDREYVVTTVLHEGDAASAFDLSDASARAQAYRNRFECAPASTPVRPPPPPTKLFQVLEPARVVGPQGEEIYTDEFGRIKVQFFWDNEGAFNQFSSCWIRVVQNWSGSSWGFQFVPRVGMEVLVSFQYGDQDRPVVLGCLFNGENSFPFGLPDDRTRSGIRTQSSPGAGGYNELSFQDLAGREQVHLRAQRDLDEVVGHDRTRHVTHDERVAVGHSQNVQVDHDQELRVGRNRSVDVRGSQNSTVSAGRTQRVGGSDHVLIRGHGFYTAQENYNLQVGRNFNTYVGTEDEPGGMNVWSWGPCQWGTGAAHSFGAQERITLRVGESAIELTPDTITLRAPHVVVDGTEDVLVRGKDPALQLTDVAKLVASEVTVQSRGATMKMDAAQFRVEAPAHVLTSGSGAAAEARQRVTDETKPFRLKLSNSQFEPYANRPYELVVGTLRLTGTTDGDGEINEEVPAEARHATVRLWIGEPPTGSSRVMQVELVDALPPASSVAGLKLRLAHLGYYLGEVDDDVDAGLHEAVRRFQQDHDMDVTGDPADVASRVEEVHTG